MSKRLSMLYILGLFCCCIFLPAGGRLVLRSCQFTSMPKTHQLTLLCTVWKYLQRKLLLFPFNFESSNIITHRNRWVWKAEQKAHVCIDGGSCWPTNKRWKGGKWTSGLEEELHSCGRASIQQLVAERLMFSLLPEISVIQPAQISVLCGGQPVERCHRLPKKEEPRGEEGDGVTLSFTDLRLWWKHTCYCLTSQRKCTIFEASSSLDDCWMAPVGRQRLSL